MKRQIIVAPEDVDYCEYECRKPQCLNSDWEACATRERHAASCKAAAAAAIDQAAPDAPSSRSCG